MNFAVYISIRMPPPCWLIRLWHVATCSVCPQQTQQPTLFVCTLPSTFIYNLLHLYSTLHYFYYACVIFSNLTPLPSSLHSSLTYPLTYNFRQQPSSWPLLPLVPLTSFLSIHPTSFPRAGYAPTLRTEAWSFPKLSCTYQTTRCYVTKS
jgi:hypothetical protein